MWGVCVEGGVGVGGLSLEICYIAPCKKNIVLISEQTYVVSTY